MELDLNAMGKTGPQPIKKGTILILEDQKGFRRIYRDVLEKDGYDVLEAVDGEAGWDIIYKQKPDLILLDLGLPIMDGFQVLEKLKRSEQTKDIPVIVFSALGEPMDVQKALRMGANDYTVKGFYTPRQVLSKIKDILTENRGANKNANTYRLVLKPFEKDSIRLAMDLGLSEGHQCKDCKVEMDLELCPDYARAEGHWFASRFICPQCGTAF
jgi:DNA-binding response OmpR family regulator